MKINGKVEIQGFTRIEDLDAGTVFTFCDDAEIFMKGFDECDNMLAIALATGDVFDVFGKEWEDRPVKTLKAELFINFNKINA